MGGSSPPEAPDPWDTAQSQFGLNFGTANMNNVMGHVNQNTPYGSLNYSQTGTTQMPNPFTGEMMDIPQFTADTTLNPVAQQTFNRNARGQKNLATAFETLSGRQADELGRPVNMNRAPDANYDTVNGTNLLEKFRPAGDIKQTFGAAGPITKSYGTDFSADRQRVEDTLMARMQPRLDQDRAAMEASLANRGIKLGSGAYSDAQGDFGRNLNDARMGAILGAGDEQGRMVGMEANRAQFENQAQQQQYGQNLGRAAFSNAGQQSQYDQNLGRATFSNNANQQEFQNQLARAGFNNNATQQQRGDWLSEQYGQRNQGLNELIGLMSGSQVQAPNFSVGQGAQMPGVDYGGMVGQNYQNQLQGWQAQQANNPWNGVMGGLFGSANTAIMSDRRLKTDVSFLGYLRDLPLYAYRYIWGGPRMVGVMAQDMLRLRPAAVVQMGDYLAVDYGRL